MIAFHADDLDMREEPRSPQLRAIIYIRQGPDADRWERACQQHCEQQGYEIVALVLDDPEGNRWPSVATMLMSGEAEVVIVRRLDDLPADRIPRAEVAGQTVGERPPSQRRPKAARWSQK